MFFTKQDAHPNLQYILPSFSCRSPRYAALIQAKSPANCDAHLAESIFQTRSRKRKVCLIMKEDCIFCKIAKGEIHSATVYEDSHFTVILDVNPATKGHCLIIPKEHFDNIYDLDGETAGKLFALATCIARAMRDALKCDGLNLVQNNGEIAGQTVNHFHLHLIPRYEGDGLNLNWPQQEISAEQLEEIRQSIKKSI